MREVVAQHPRGRAWALWLALLAALLLLVPLWSASPLRAARAADSTITIRAFDLGSGNALGAYTYLVNVDNAHDPRDPDPLQRPGIAPTESNSPVVGLGDQSSPTQSLPAGRYLISVRSPDHKMWGKHITLPRDAGNVDVSLRGGPFPLGKIQAFVFHDNHWVNNVVDEGEEGLAGFHITIEEQTESQVTVDYFNNPLCGGDCVTDENGMVEIKNLGPGTYFVYATPPDGSDWIQNSTFDGGFGVQAGVEEASDGLGAPGEALWEPVGLQTSYWFGFVRPMEFANPGPGSISGRALNWVGWPPFDHLVSDPNEPVRNAYVALSDTATDDQVYTGQADGDGNFTIPNVPAGSYMLSIWDEQLTYIIRFVHVIVGAGEDVDLGDVGVSRWFGWLSGDVYFDDNQNGIRDAGERPIPNTDVDQRWRDGSIKEATFTDAAGHYEYPLAEGGPLGKFVIGEQGFGRFGTSGASVHNEYDPSIVTPVPSALGGGLLTNQLLTEGHRSEVDWGKYQYADDEPGQIVGIVMNGTTRNELDARFQLAEDYEPGIPGVKVLLEGLGPDLTPNTADDPTLNDYITDAWSAATDCDVTDSDGNPITDLNPLVGANCLEVPITGVETKDGAFDGGYAFADMCPLNPDGTSTYPCDDEDKVPLKAGTYITHVIAPEDAHGNPLWHVVREEDVNVDNGADFVEPAIPPPPCTGDLHLVPADGVPERSPYGGRQMPLCDKRLVLLQNRQNANADFFLMTNFDTGPDVQPAGRLVGLVTDDIYFDVDKQSIWYGEARPVQHMPIGIRDYNWRLLTTVETDEHGIYEVLLPSTETFNCPIPQGPCPGMYVVVVNDPGDKAHPNANYNPNYLTASLAWDVWPGLTTQLDTPVDPISGVGCELPVGAPELLQVSKPYVKQGDAGAARRITIQGDSFGATAGTVTLTDPRPDQAVRTLTVANGGIVSWANRQIVINVPAIASAFKAGPKQLGITGANGMSTTNAITIHALGTGYNPAIVNAAGPSDPHAIQNAIDAAGSGSLVVLQPGVYRENVILWKSLMLQGLGPGGIVGGVEPGDRPAEDPRFNIPGTVIDGRFFQDNKADWAAKVASLGSLAGVDATHPVLEGADITVVAKNTRAFGAGLNAARIDGIGLTTGHGQGAGGIQLQAYASNLQITNNVLESNGGVFAGAIGIGQPYAATHNQGVKIAFDRVLGNGGLTRSGGIGIFRSSGNYEIANSVICSNFGVEYGAGISHWGLSPGGKIHDNLIYYNDAVDSGAGIAIAQETPQPAHGRRLLGDGSGSVDVDRNLIEGNYSGDDGGGIFVQNALTSRINIRNNLIVDNGASDLGGAVMLDDSSNVAFVNNTVANNVSTGAAEDSDDNPHSAGLASEANDPLFQATLPAGAPTFSAPVALFNNIFWENEAFTLTQRSPGAELVSQGFMDFEVHGTTGTFTPRYSLLTAPYGPPNQGNIVGQDPQFVDPFTLELTVMGSRLDPQAVAVTINAQDPLVGLPGNYHLQSSSPAIDQGVQFSNFPFPPAAASPDASSILAPLVDYDGQTRPQLRSTRTLTQWDLGADEVPR